MRAYIRNLALYITSLFRWSVLLHDDPAVSRLQVTVPESAFPRHRVVIPNLPLVYFVTW